MTKTEVTKAALDLSINEQLDLARELWNNVAPDTLDLSPELKEMLEARLAERDANPDASVSWEDVRSRLRKKSAEPRTR